MMDPNDKWVWADEKPPSPPTSPLLDEQLTPIVEWPDLPPESPARPESVEAAVPEPVLSEPIVSEPVIAEPAKVVAAAPVPEPVREPAPEPLPTASRRRDISPSVVRAIVLHLEGQLEQAIQEIETGLKNGEPEAELYAALGALQMDLDRFEDAANSYKIVLKHEPENQTCRHNLEICAQKLSEPKKPPKPSPILVKAIMLHMEGKIEDAIRELQRGVKAGEKSLDVFAGLGHLQFEAGRFDAAADAYRQVLDREPLHKTCHYNLAVCLEKTGRHKDALASFEKAFEINSARIEIGLGVGVSLLHLRRFAEAVAAFETCLKTHPADETAVFGKAFALQSQGRHADAETAYAEILKRNPAHEE